MEAVTITLSDAEMAKVTAAAQQLGITPEELIKASLKERLDFEEAAEFVLKKNSSLYQRLGGT